MIQAIITHAKKIMIKHIGCLLRCLIVSLIALLPITVVAEELGFDPPGKLVNVDGHRMHIDCIGNRSPTVVFDSGTGGFSLEWREIQRSLSKSARVCAYDRAGYGWSDLSRLPRTTRNIVHELHSLLKNAGVNGPYIIVGHSFGGFTAQYFARQFQDEIAGIVLIESSHEEQVDRLPRADSPAVVGLSVPGRRDLRYSRHTVVSVPRVHKNFPEEGAFVAQQLMRRRMSLSTWKQELSNYAKSAYELQMAYYKPLPETPLIVLTRGRRVWPSTDYGDAMEARWTELQNELTHLNTNARQVIAYHSGHQIHLDEPEIVISAIHDVLDSVQR